MGGFHSAVSLPWCCHCCIVHILIITFFVSSIQAGHRFTGGSSGDLCEGSTRNCLTRLAQCNQTTDFCVCDEGVIGDGTFQCYLPDMYNTLVENDPQLSTVTGEKVELPITCKYLLTHFRTNFTAMVNSTCEVKVLPFNKKIRGKIYVHGIDIALRVSTPYSSPPIGDISWRVTGEAHGGQYEFRDNAVYNFTSDGPWPRDSFTYISIGAENIFARYDAYNNMFYLKVGACGFDIRFRPFDVLKGKDQTQVPGVGVSVKAATSTEWLSPGETMGLSPTGQLLGDIARGFQTVSQAMVARLLSSGVTQNQPLGSEHCTSLAQSVSKCPTRSATASAFNTCFFILNVPKFVRCYDNTYNGDQVLSLFEQCLNAECLGNATECGLVKQQIQRCQGGNSAEVTSYLTRPC